MMNPLASRLSLSGWSIHRHIATLAIAVAVMVLGGFFALGMQVDLLPSITYPRIGLRADAPGLSPEVAIDEVTRPLEAALSATEGVVQVYSQTREGRISLDLFFQPGGDLDRALNDATAAFNRARGRLPDIVDNARLFKFDPSQLPVYELAITAATLEPVALRVLADEEIARELDVIPGVASVDVSGGVREEVQVVVDLERLQAAGVGLQDVLDRLDEANQDISGGRIYGEMTEPLTRAVGRFRSVAELRSLSFPSDRTLTAADLSAGSTANRGAGSSLDGSSAEGNSAIALPPRRVYLDDVAEIIDGTEEQRVQVRLNGIPAVKLSIQKQPDANTITVVDALKARLSQLQADGIIPDTVQLVPVLDESIFIRNAIHNVIIAGLVGTGLAGVAVLLFLGSLRQTVIIVTAIPLATLAAVILMRLCGLSLNVFSLGGLALGVGIVVDNSIVMLEAIVEGTRSRLGSLDPGSPVVNPSPSEVMDRAIASSQAVESALIASTSTNLVAVVPFLFIGGFIALLFNELILTISFAVGASIVVAATVVPMLASRTLGIRARSGFDRLPPVRWFQGAIARLTAGYGRSLRWVVHHRWWVVLLVVAIALPLSTTLLNRLPQEILPRIATGQVRLWAQFPPGTPLADNQRVMDLVDDIVLAQPETAAAFTTVGGFLFGSNTSENPLRSSSTIALTPHSDAEAYITRVQAALDALNLVNIRLSLRPESVRGLILNNSPVRGAELDVILQGADAEALNQAGRQVLDALDRQATLVQFRPDADRPQPELQIRPDPERLADLDLTIADVGASLETAVQGRVATALQRGDRLVDVRVRLSRSAITDPRDLNAVPLFTQGNRPVTLSDVATIAKGRAPSEIQRIDRRQVFILAGNLTEGASLGEAIAEADQILAEVPLPPGVRRVPSAAAASNAQIQQALPLLGGLAAFLVFVVMAVQYNSLLDPLAIMAAIPLALTGGIVGLAVTQTAIGATVVVGAVLLVGIAVNNAIVLIELANQLRETHNLSRTAAILKAAPQRLRPILMTTITTVLGMFPLAIGFGEGSEFLRPLGIVVFAGLSVTTLLTLFVVPCLYLLVHHDWRGGWRGRDRPPVNAQVLPTPTGTVLNRASRPRPLESS
jgi:multidrug efflux pump subunit AcrB